MEGLSVISAASMMWDAAGVRLAGAAHELAKVEISIDPPVDVIAAINEAEITDVLIETAGSIQQYSLNILA
jgi:ABC-type Zn2+ transport system substrate-binding protein/surface adhesin